MKRKSKSAAEAVSTSPLTFLLSSPPFRSVLSASFSGKVGMIVSIRTAADDDLDIGRPKNLFRLSWAA
jgi:hypothetical protein